jgi:hypothetical protein
MPAPQIWSPQQTAGGTAQREPPGQSMQTMPWPQTWSPQHSAGGTAHVGPRAQRMQTMPPPQTSPEQHSTGFNAQRNPVPQLTQLQPGPQSPLPGRQSPWARPGGEPIAATVAIARARRKKRVVEAFRPFMIAPSRWADPARPPVPSASLAWG